MSATLLHHGHIRLLKHASNLGRVVVLLCSDSEIRRHKGYVPELSFSERREIVRAIRFVEEVVESPWIVDDSFMDLHNLDFLMHGDDNSNKVSGSRVIVIPRTEGVSSTTLRRKAAENLLEISRNNQGQGLSIQS
jgi:glycerol-3-phosphate cytidylyltransferase